MPARVIPMRGRGNRGVVAAADRGSKPFESALERDLLIQLDFDDSVASFEVQPVTISYQDPEGTDRQYTPDVLIRFCRARRLGGPRRPWLCEVKYRQDLRRNWAALKPRFRAARRYASRRRWEFHILTELEIRTPYLDNARFLRRYRDLNADVSWCTLVLDALDIQEESDPQSLIAAVFRDPWNQATLLPVVWYLVANRSIGVDLTRPLTMRSRIWAS
jgi:hypothetical protein